MSIKSCHLPWPWVTFSYFSYRPISRITYEASSCKNKMRSCLRYYFPRCVLTVIFILFLFLGVVWPGGIALVSITLLRAQLILGWMTDRSRVRVAFAPSWYSQANSAVHGFRRNDYTGDDHSHCWRRNGKFCVTVGPWRGLLANWYG